MAKQNPKPNKVSKRVPASTRRVELARKGAEFAIKLIDNWDTFSKKRLQQIRDYELAYYGSVKPSLVGRSNIPFPAMAKYIDELKGRLDDFPSIKIENHQRLAQLRVTKKLQGAIDKFKKPSSGDWARNDRMGRNNALFAGFVATDFFTEDNDGKFKALVQPIDHNDFVFEAIGGSNLEEHQGIGKFPLFRTKGQLEQRAEDDIYDAGQVKKVLEKTNASDFKATNDRYFQGRYDRYKAMGLDIMNSGYAGQGLFSLAQMQITHPENGKRYLIVVDYKTGEWLRFERLKAVYGTDEYSIKLYQTHEDPNVVMCKSTCDDLYPVAESLRIKINQVFDFKTKQLWGQKAVDPNFFPDLDDLEWKRPDQIIVARSYQNKPISQGIYEIKPTGDDTGSLDFIKWLDAYLASVAGISANEVSEDAKKVGVFFGQMQRTAARLGPLNKSYAEMWEKGITHLIYQIRKNMSEPMMVQLIGNKGVEWEELKGEELKKPGDFEVVCASSSVETEMNEAMQKRRETALETVAKDPDLKKEINPRWLVEEILRMGKWPDEEIKRGMDVKNYGSEEILSRADQAIEQIVKGEKTPKTYHGADIAFMQYILDYAREMSDDKPELRTAIMEYGLAHQQIVVQNMAEKAALELASKGADPNALDANGKPKAPPADAGAIPPGPRAPSKTVVPVKKPVAAAAPHPSLPTDLHA